MFATDGERTLIDAFFHELRFCKKNIHDNKYKESLAKEIIDDVFRKQVGSTYCEGLVDGDILSEAG